jgi:excisionase family DNA binding protein
LVKALRVLACRLTRGPFSCPCTPKCSTLYSPLQATASYQKGVVGTATEELLSLQEAADHLGVSVYTVRRWIKEGKLRAFKPGKEYRIQESDFKEFLAAREVHPKAPRRSPSEPSFNDVLEQQRLLNYLRPWLDYISGKAAWARSILEKTSSFAEPLVEEPGVTPAATLTMWNTHIDTLRNDAHVLANTWGKILEGISEESLPSEERGLLEDLRSELQGFESAVEELQAKFYSDFQQHSDAVKPLPNLRERRPSGATAADKRESAGA